MGIYSLSFSPPPLKFKMLDKKSFLFFSMCLLPALCIYFSKPSDIGFLLWTLDTNSLSLRSIASSSLSWSSIFSLLWRILSSTPSIILRMDLSVCACVWSIEASICCIEALVSACICSILAVHVAHDSASQSFPVDISNVLQCPMVRYGFLKWCLPKNTFSKSIFLDGTPYLCVLYFSHLLRIYHGN